MKITALLENTTRREGIKTEHGLSLYIESAAGNILFDMGQTDMFYENANALNIDLSAVDIAILSHGHYDHGGGLEKFLEINHRARVYIHKDAFLPHYNGTEKYIGLDTSLQSHPQICFTDGELSVAEGARLFPAASVAITHPPIAHGLTEKVGDAFIPDDFRHEQYLLLRENGKTVLVSGCSHLGILDIAAHFSPDVLIGGFHYSKLPTDGWLEGAAGELSAHKTDFYTCHCTGEEQFHFMSRYMPRLRYLASGDSVTL